MSLAAFFTQSSLFSTTALSGHLFAETHQVLVSGLGTTMSPMSHSLRHLALQSGVYLL